MNPFRVSAALIGACLTAIAVAATAAVAAPATTTAARADTTLSFHVTFRPFEQNYVDIGPAGPGIGDTIVFQDDITDTHAHKVGVEGGACTLTAVLTDSFQIHCTGTISLPDGQIAYQGLASNAPVKTLAVVGGTGPYTGARGEAVLVELGHDHAGTLTIRLLPHD